MYNINFGLKIEGLLIGGWPSILLLLMPVFPQALFSLVSGHFVFLSFFTAWHG
jgi:hypothetical protein